MQIGIGLPATVVGVEGQNLLNWAKRAEQGPFSSLGIIDRLVYPGYDPLITLAAVAGITQRIRLMTTILIVPLHNTGILAKQAASLDALSGGRLTLGVGVGGREDDFTAAPALFRQRGKRFEEQLATLQHIWAGLPYNEAQGIGPIGPPPVQFNGPEVLIGGNSLAALQRVGHWGNGVILGGSPVLMQRWYAMALHAWNEAGRGGRPRLVGGMYYGLGEDAKEQAARYMRQFYAYAGPMAEQIIERLALTPQKVRATIHAYEDIGVDELILWPCLSDLDQIDRLNDLL